MKPVYADFELTSRTAMLMHADSIDGATKLDKWRKDPANKNQSVAGDDRCPPWSWHTYVHHDGTFVAMPAQSIMACLRAAGAKMILKGRKTYKEATQSGLLIETEFCDLTIGPDRDVHIAVADIVAMRDEDFPEQMARAKRLGFELDARRARIGTKKHVRVRPKFATWRVSGRIQILTPQDIPVKVLAQLFDLAGNIGLGDWRPGCSTPGSFGMFSAKVKEV